MFLLYPSIDNISEVGHGLDDSLLARNYIPSESFAQTSLLFGASSKMENSVSVQNLKYTFDSSAMYPDADA